MEPPSQRVGRGKQPQQYRRHHPPPHRRLPKPRPPMVTGPGNKHWYPPQRGTGVIADNAAGLRRSQAGAAPDLWVDQSGDPRRRGGHHGQLRLECRYPKGRT